MCGERRVEQRILASVYAFMYNSCVCVCLCHVLFESKLDAPVKTN